MRAEIKVLDQAGESRVRHHPRLRCPYVSSGIWGEEGYGLPEHGRCQQIL